MASITDLRSHYTPAEIRENERRARLAAEMHHDGTPKAPDPDSFDEIEISARWGVEYMIVRAKLATSLEQRIARLEQALQGIDADACPHCGARAIAQGALAPVACDEVEAPDDEASF